VPDHIYLHAGDCIYNDESAKRVKYAYDAGHQIASHTWSHAHLNNLTWDQGEHALFPGVRRTLNLDVKCITNSGWSNVGVIHHMKASHLSNTIATEALQRIAGVTPAFMRPRTSCSYFR
jgi:peptidoglycan/xylan/chitin deacetylase (PgdA/CDA1 family)